MELAQLKFTYIPNSKIKNNSSRPPSGLSSEYNSVQSILVVLGLCNVYYINEIKTNFIYFSFQAEEKNL